MFLDYQYSEVPDPEPQVVALELELHVRTQPLPTSLFLQNCCWSTASYGAKSMIWILLSIALGLRSHEMAPRDFAKPATCIVRDFSVVTTFLSEDPALICYCPVCDHVFL